MSIIAPRSFCPSCRHQLRWYQLIPIVSFLIQGGKCSYCSAQISFQYPLIEILSSVALIVPFMHFGFSSEFFLCSLFFYILLLILFVDWEYFIIPNKIIIVGLIISIAFYMIFYQEKLLSHLLFGVLAAGSMFIVRYLGNLIFRKESLGIGDIKLAFFIGMFLPFDLFFVSVWIAAVLGVMYSCVAIIRSKEIFTTRKVPFGSLLSISSACIYWYSSEISLMIKRWLIFNQ